MAIDINNPADLEAQLLRLKDLQSRRESDASTITDAEPSNQDKKTWLSYFGRDIQNTTYLQIQFLILSITTGILDAVTFAVYSVFVSKQTGNTVFLALAALKHDSVYQTEPNVAVSISVFFAGACIFGHLGHRMGQNRRIWLLASNTVQTALLFAATALRYWGSSQENGPYALGVIALLSFAMGSQVAQALSIKVPDINTVMITGAMVQVASDSDVLARQNASRNRRVAFFLAVLLGAFVGSLATSFVDSCLGLLLAGILKAVVTIMFLF